MTTAPFWGYHALFDAAGCDRAAVTNPELIKEFTIELVKTIDMVAYGEPQVVHFGDDNKAGYTLVQLIETSNIIAHFCDDTGDTYFDVFSCRTFDVDAAAELFCNYFRPTRIRTNFITRQA